MCKLLKSLPFDGKQAHCFDCIGLRTGNGLRRIGTLLLGGFRLGRRRKRLQTRGGSWAMGRSRGMRTWLGRTRRGKIRPIGGIDKYLSLYLDAELFTIHTRYKREVEGMGKK